MAEHRRVEPRSIMGSGMSTDPERVRELEEEAERKSRVWRERGDTSFGDVLKTAPARAAPDEEGSAPPDREGEEPVDGDDEASAKDAAPTGEVTDAKSGKGKKAQPKKPVPTGPRVPPDPRAQALHRLLDTARTMKGAPMPKVGASSETPPTGSVKNAPSPKKKGPP